MKLGVTLFGIAAAGLALLAATPATAGAPSIELLVAKKEEGPYFRFTELIIEKGKTKKLYFFASNAGASDQTLLLFDESPVPQSDYQIKWYRGLKAKPGRDITDQVRSSEAYEFDGPARSARTFTMTLKRKQGNEACVGADLGSEPALETTSAVVVVNDGPCVI